MHPTVITGASRPAAQATPLDALQAFYYAFNHRDLHAMEANWSHSAEAVLCNPLGGIRRGWAEIRPLYRQIFGGRAQVYVEYYDFSIVETAEMFCAVGRERGWFRTDEGEIALAIRTSRFFRKENGIWRQCHHHGSIDDPALLLRYQQAVMSANASVPAS